ncbi:tyrosine-type recombinase/integrase [Clostridium botulinum]|uniref:tyrosine-type recombinase/integrase n=1 Tax=Clostridium botulinum TaxID=1491 RepID=UPI0006A4962B|nr:site-specific integrase [Clostridium botulinum]KOC50137.1 integrase [Clostridium botulinum]
MTSKMPNGDKWELINNDNSSQYYGRKYKFDFSYIESDSIKNVVKTYIWRNYKEDKRVVNKLYDSVLMFKIFNEFAISSNICSFKDLDNNDISKFITHLKTTLNKKNKPYSYEYQRKCLGVIKAIIKWGQFIMPKEMPKGEIFKGNEYSQNGKFKIDFIPDKVLEKINKSLVNEENLYVKYGIIILQSTGMRIGDMLKLTTDSVKPHLINGYTLTWYEHKIRKERKPVPISNECAIAVENLINYTKDLREQADSEIKNYLFIHKPSKGKNVGKTSDISQSTFRNWIKNFIEKNDIKNSDGSIYNLKTHQFRRTLATDMLSKGTDLKVIQEFLGHSSPTTTKRNYADVKDKERAEVFKNIGIIGNINKVDETVITDKNDLIWFKKNKDKGARMEDGYCTKPCSDGKICDRLLKRQKCYTCSRYITTPEYLQAHKNHLAELEKQLEGNIYGDHYAEHFLPTIKILKEIVKRLEEIQDGNN